MDHSGTRSVEPRRYLEALGLDLGRVTGFEVLAAGGSGAAVWRVRRAEGDLVLKVAAAGSPAWVRERARREVRFYRELAADAGVPVPPLVAGAEHDALGTLLLLGYLDPAPVADPLPWMPGEYVAVAETVATLHAAWWGRETDLGRARWLRPDRAPSAGELAGAARLWAGLATERGLSGLLTSARLVTLSGYLRRVEAGDFDPPPFPLTLCHGDFHAGNLLREPAGRWVVADWQEVGPGRGPDDLAFFALRASSGGSPVPFDAMLDAWTRVIRERTSAQVMADAARRVAEAAELRCRLVQWPAYLSGGDTAWVAGMLDRIDELAGRR